MTELTEDEKKALRGSKFAPLPPPASGSSRTQPRLAHPAGPMKTNKAAALAKFLERKLQQGPHGLASVDPKLVELAIEDARRVVNSSGTLDSGRIIHHVDSFDDPKYTLEDDEQNSAPANGIKFLAPKKQKKAKKKNKNNNKELKLDI